MRPSILGRRQHDLAAALNAFLDPLLQRLDVGGADLFSAATFSAMAVRTSSGVDVAASAYRTDGVKSEIVSAGWHGKLCSRFRRKSAEPKQEQTSWRFQGEKKGG
jgi:hypothetical protein